MCSVWSVVLSVVSDASNDLVDWWVMCDVVVNQDSVHVTLQVIRGLGDKHGLVRTLYRVHELSAYSSPGCGPAVEGSSVEESG